MYNRCIYNECKFWLLTGDYQIIKTGHWITDRISQELKEFGMTEPQFNVLRILQGQKGDPLTVQEIQERMVQRGSNVTRIIDKLIEKVLLERHECATNIRWTLILPIRVFFGKKAF